MINTKAKYIRPLVQTLIFLFLTIIILVYRLYINGLIDIKILGIGDLNPYGGWNALRETALGSGYVFEGISKSMALTLALTASAIIGGRFFCGWICPVGAIQDLTSRLGGKSGKGSNPLWFKYPILLMLLIISILGYGAKIAEFSPWRALLNLPDINSGFFILAGVFLASIFLSRFFCRYLCPLGAAQALVGSMSILSLKHSKNCTRCGSCLRDCPVGIRLSAGSETISPECIRCMKCVENCAADKENDIRLKIGNKSVSLTAYAVIMPILFAVLWLGLPQVWSGSQSSGDIVLGSLKDGTYLGEAKGFAGKIITEVYVTEGRISDIKVIKHQESKGWYEEVYMTLPREIISKQRLNVDAISGATKTSKGFIESVEDAIKKAQ